MHPGRITFNFYCYSVNCQVCTHLCVCLCVCMCVCWGCYPSLVCLIPFLSLLCYLCLFQTPLCDFLSHSSFPVSLSVFTLEHTHTHTHTAMPVSCSCCCAVLQMPQCAVISWEIWGCYKLCTLNNRRQRIPPLYCLCAPTARGCIRHIFSLVHTADVPLLISAR